MESPDYLPPEETTIAGWNAEHAFDENADPARQEAAYEHVGELARAAGVVGLTEFMVNGNSDQHREAVLGRLADEHGLVQNIVSEGVRPDKINVALLSRDPLEGGVVDLGGGREVPYYDVEGIGRFMLLHNWSNNVKERKDVAKDIINNLTGPTAIFGDSNEVQPFDSLSSGVLKITDSIFRVLPIPELDFTTGNKWKRAAADVIRGSAMARGAALKTYARAGFYDADPHGDPTVFRNIPVIGEIRGDRALATPDIALSNFTVLPRVRYANGKYVSDHASYLVTASSRRPQHGDSVPRTPRERVTLRSR